VGGRLGTVLAVPLLALFALFGYVASQGTYDDRTLLIGGIALLVILLLSILVAVFVGRSMRPAGVPARGEATVALPPRVAQRAEVSAMFVNLARRSSRLVDALIQRLDHAEADEADPDRLAQLFDFDHLATRMRHANDSVLVLAGSDASRAREHPIPLLDLLRAAQSQIEQYKRVEYGRVDGDVAIAPHAIDAVVHALAELLDNAARYSPPEHPVLVEGRRSGDGAIVQITDAGIGVADALDLLNARLAEPPGLGVAESRSMGLAVVAHLARRYGLTVHLRAEPAGGTVAIVELPADLVRHAAPELSSRSGDFVVLPRPLERATALPGGEPLEVPLRRPVVVTSRTDAGDDGLPRRVTIAHLLPHGRVLANGHAVGVAHVIPSALEEAPQEVAPDEARALLSSFQRALGQAQDMRAQDKPAQGKAS
jgi:signal transduction histidine kinase